MDLWLETAGERLAIKSDLRWVVDLLEESAAGEARRSPTLAGPTIFIEVERSNAAFPTAGFEVLTRGAVHCNGELVIRDVCTSGFDLRLSLATGAPRFTFRWRPPRATRITNMGLRSRFVLLARAALVQYPTLWWAGTKGRAPLHAGAVTAGPATALLAGPGGVGKTTLLAAELAAGETATSDNVVVSDGETVWGLVEPIRIEGASGRRMPHDRAEMTMNGRVASLAPDCAVLLRRGDGSKATVSPATPAEITRSLVGGTYMAGELRRYWALAATLALGTGVGPAHPGVESVAATLAGRLRGMTLTLAIKPGARLAELLSTKETETNRCASAS